MRIQPLSGNDASEDSKVIFREVTEALELDAVPLLFSYLANAPSYLSYLWSAMVKDIQSKEFSVLLEKIVSFCNQSMGIIYSPSHKALAFVENLSKEKREELEEVVNKLQQLNTILFLFSLDLREDLKSAYTQVEESERLAEGKGRQYSDAFQEKGGKAMTASSQMLAPLFGNTPPLPRVDDFFSIVSEEMGNVIRTESYLKTRVGLERIGLSLLPSMPYRMNSNYKVFMELIEDTYVAYDLLYLLTHVFPQEFPRLLLTASLMEQVLGGEKRAIMR